ncbi:MAG: hypothetical protein ACR2OV_05075 [Hyphomicrobiaceae bacterium]
MSAICVAERPKVRQSICREDILGHETAWEVSQLGAVQFRHDYDLELLKTIKNKAMSQRDDLAERKHLDLTFITGADRFIPEINEIIYDRKRLDYLSELAGTKLEPYPLSIVGSTVTFMGPRTGDGTVDWHCDGVPVTELIPLEISSPILGGELEIYLGNCEVGKAKTNRHESISEREILRIPHRVGSSTLGHFLGVLHRTAPIQFGHRITLVLNLRSVERPFVDDNRLFYLAADTDQQREWVSEMAQDVWEKQLPAYRRFEAARTGQPTMEATADDQVDVAQKPLTV